jgi:excinuclease ABC subunit B
MRLQLKADYQPQGDQPEAIEALVKSIRSGNAFQTLMGVTGSGKTYTMANLIERLQRPTLILSHNKTLAAQLYSEFKAFFPHNAVEYFVSYYDYYQPEAYVPATDTYIEKDSNINEEIERLRIAATSSLISRRDVIVVASVSCIYGLGSPQDFTDLRIDLAEGMELNRDHLLERLVANMYARNDIEFKRSTFRVRGEIVDIFPAYMESAIRLEFWGDEVEGISELDPLTGITGKRLRGFQLYPANQYITSRNKLLPAIEGIKKEMATQVADFEKNQRLLEAQRIKMRTEYDLELLQEMGFCNGIENYSMWLSGRKPGERPFCLLDFFPKDYLVILDESHVTLPQIGGMYHGDRARKERLVDFGFRLPSALENRPLKPEEFNLITGQTLYVSATPGKTELERSSTVAEQVIRPTGLLDPVMEVRPTDGQVEDLMGEIRQAVARQQRVLVTTLTKRMSEDLSAYLRDGGIRVEYLHSDIDAIERVEILRNLRRGDFDVLVGVNLLREGLDLPEVALVAILDADKEGFLRSTTSLVQTVGRAARHEDGRALLYANRITDSLQATLDICKRRRDKQQAFNQEHGITPKSVRRGVQESLHTRPDGPGSESTEAVPPDEAAVVLAELEEEMLEAARNLDFEKAAVLRDQISALKGGHTSGQLRSSPKTTRRRKVVKRGKDVTWGKAKRK